MLSREEAIRKHREMWNWIADRIMERKQPVIIDNLKREYVLQHKENIAYNCYMCDYCIDVMDGEEFEERCKYCPLDWESDGDENGLYQCLDNHDEMGLYVEAKRTAVWEEQYKLCKKIANLKEV